MGEVLSRILCRAGLHHWRTESPCCDKLWRWAKRTPTHPGGDDAER